MAAPRRVRWSSQRGSGALQTLALAVLVVVIAAGAGLVGAMAYGERAQPSAAPSIPPVVEDHDAVGTLKVRCIDNGAGIEVPAVNAKADGVHVAIEGAEGQEVFFQSESGVGYQLQLREDGGKFELPLPPGSWHGACAPQGSPPPARNFGASFTVADPNEHYVVSDPVCPEQGCCVQVGELPNTFVQDQETALREVFADDGIVAADVIERAAYPRSVSRLDPPNPLVFRVMRGDQIVAHIDAVEGNDGWSYQMVGCPSLEA